MTQLAFPSHGGRRDGAGRPKGERVSHQERPRFARPTPAHVTLRVGREVWNLRRRSVLREIRACFTAALGRFGLRIVEFAILGDHLHLIVEADDSAALSRGMQGLCIRVAKALNRLMSRHGRVFADHYHAHLLETPSELVNAIAYVLGNAARHYGEAGPDPYSSTAPAARAVLAIPVSWLLRVGWRRAKRIPRSGSSPFL